MLLHVPTINQAIIPAVESAIVLCDKFIESSIAYQAMVRDRFIFIL